MKTEKKEEKKNNFYVNLHLEGGTRRQKINYTMDKDTLRVLRSNGAYNLKPYIKHYILPH